MEKYWPKRKDFPHEVTATDVASSDEESGNESDNDNDNNTPHGLNNTSAPVSSISDNSDTDDEAPDAAYARF